MVSGSHVQISWIEPFTGGSPITSYTIKIRLRDGISFTTDLSNCNGANAAVVNTRSCMVPVSTLRNKPFEIEWATSVWATVQAHNSYGSSGVSEQGNGAIIVTIPDAPVNLRNDFEVSTANQIKIMWDDGAFNGGKPVTDYRVTYD